MTSLLFLLQMWISCSSWSCLGEGRVCHHQQGLTPFLLVSSLLSSASSSLRGPASRCRSAPSSLLAITPAASPWSSASLLIASTAPSFSLFCLRERKFNSECSSHRGMFLYTWGTRTLWVLTITSTMDGGILLLWLYETVRYFCTHPVVRRAYMDICPRKKTRAWIQRAPSCWAKWATTQCHLKVQSVNLTFIPRLRQLITIVITLRNTAEKLTHIGPFFHPCYLYFQTRILLQLIQLHHHWQRDL